MKLENNTHHAPGRPPVRSAVAAAVVSASLAAAALGSAPALADPGQGGLTPSAPNTNDGGQGGVTPEQGPSGGDQGGVTSPPPAPQSDNYGGPGVIPAPPQTGPYQSPSTPQTYPQDYNVVPTAPLHAPKPTPPVRRIAPPPNKIRIGNYETDIPQGMSMSTVRSINDWMAYGEAEIARNLISVGVPRDQASRQAAATIIGVALGGTVGATALGVPAAVIGGLGGGLIGGVGGAIAGTIIGSGIPPLGPVVGGPIGFAAGTAGGAAVGAAALGIPAAVVGAVAGGTIGGLLAFALGAGDPGSRAPRPDVPGAPSPQRQNPKPLPQLVTGSPQFEFRLSAPAAQKAGLPAVDYVVTGPGDVRASVTVGGQTVQATIPAAVANAPYAALGPAGKSARQAVQKTTEDLTRAAQRAVPGLQVTWPAPAPHKPQHSRR